MTPKLRATQNRDINTYRDWYKLLQWRVENVMIVINRIETFSENYSIALRFTWTENTRGLLSCRWCWHILEEGTSISAVWCKLAHSTIKQILKQVAELSRLSTSRVGKTTTSNSISNSSKKSVPALWLRFQDPQVSTSGRLMSCSRAKKNGSKLAAYTWCSFMINAPYSLTDFCSFLELQLISKCWITEYV